MTLPFRDLVTDLLQPLQDYTRRVGYAGRTPADLKRVAITKFIARWRTEVGPDIFPAFRLIIPDRDKDRSMYKIKEANLAKLFIKILGISPASADAISIEKWKVPGPNGLAGDFPGRLYDVLERRPAISDWGSMTIEEVNQGLDELSLCTKESQQRPILTKFYRGMGAKELRWLACIILRTMKIGATERTFFDLFHPDAVKLFNKSSSLSRVCHELQDPAYRLPDAEKDITVFSCFQPQLAGFKKENLAEVVKRMGGKTFYIEEKLDGERIQLHKQGDVYKYWSRKAKDYTYLYGGSYGDASNQEGGGLTKYLRNAFDPKVKSIVLDGEMVTWNDAFDAPMPFGTLKSAAKAEKNHENTSFDAHPFYCVFDVLHLNGKSLTGYTLRKRREVLTRVIQPIARRIEVVAVEEATKESQVEARLRQCIAESSEGLVVKDPDTIYHPNDRNDSWIKVKPEYMSEFGENLDLLVIGGYFGEGRRGGIMASFICGLRKDNHFVSFCRVGGGFSGPDYAAIARITEGHWKKFDSRKPPSQFEFAMGNNGVIEAPDQWILPEHSVVIQVKAASATQSTTFAAGITLRFPRFECIREDKDWTTSTTVADFIELQKEASTSHQEKIINAHIKRKKAPARKNKPLVVLGAAVSNVEATSNLLSGTRFYIMSGSADHTISKESLEEIVRANGGIVVQHEGTASTKRKHDETLTCYVIAEREVVKVVSLKRRNTHDIYRPSFLKRCIATGRIPEPEAAMMYFMTAQSTQRVIEAADEYGDSWTNDVDVATLRRLIQGMPKGPVNTDEVRSLLQVETPLWLFSKFVGYFEDPATEPIFATAGGRVVTDIHDQSITTIIVSSTSPMAKIRSILALRDLSHQPRVVLDTWVTASWSSRTVLSESRFVA